MNAINITAGFALDIILGDPYWFPHPVKYIGKLIEFLEGLFSNINNKKAAGLLLVLIIPPLTFGITYFIASLSVIIEIILIYTVFATRSLAFEAKKVYTLLDKNNIEEAKKQLANLVSRDTKSLKEKDIIKATIETVSENIVDGIISPMFYLFIGGVPLAMAYKAVNTLDSMVGYKNEKYIDFGMASAKLDDIMNFIPSRITAFILIPAAAVLNRKNYKNTFRILLRDRFNHASPNSAQTEAAIAGALGCELGGPAKYHGKTVNRPTIGDNTREIVKSDILECIKLMYAASIIGLCLGMFISFIIIKLL